MGLARLSGADCAYALDNSKAPDEVFAFVWLVGTQPLTYVVNSVAKSCALVRLSKNSVIL